MKSPFCGVLTLQLDKNVKQRDMTIHLGNLYINKVFVFLIIIMRFTQKSENRLTKAGEICYNKTLFEKTYQKYVEMAYE